MVKLFLFIMSFDIYVLCIYVVNGSPIRKIASEEEAIAFLQRYGWIENGVTSDRASALSQKIAILAYQTFNNLRETGKLNEETLNKMKTRWCGVPDFAIKGISNDKHRYKRNFKFAFGPAHGTAKWKNDVITYNFRLDESWSNKGNYSRSRISNAKIEQEIKKAFDVWSKHIPRAFKKLENEVDADITIGFYTNNHTSNTPCDEIYPITPHVFNNTDAHAIQRVDPRTNFYFCGLMHFNDEEEWAINEGDNPRAKLIYETALHEIGHNIGLGHSAVIYPNDGDGNGTPVMNGGGKRRDLHQDDIDGVQAIYYKNQDNEDSGSIIAINCGQHFATSCNECPAMYCEIGNCGEGWCNGDCRWNGRNCVAKSEEDDQVVNCGLHAAPSCAECPTTFCNNPNGCGERWCNSDCIWNGSSCIENRFRFLGIQFPSDDSVPKSSTAPPISTLPRTPRTPASAFVFQ